MCLSTTSLCSVHSIPSRWSKNTASVFSPFTSISLLLSTEDLNIFLILNNCWPYFPCQLSLHFRAYTHSLQFLSSHSFFPTSFLTFINMKYLYNHSIISKTREFSILSHLSRLSLFTTPWNCSTGLSMASVLLSPVVYSQFHLTQHSWLSWSLPPSWHYVCFASQDPTLLSPILLTTPPQRPGAPSLVLFSSLSTLAPLVLSLFKYYIYADNLQTHTSDSQLTSPFGVSKNSLLIFHPQPFLYDWMTSLSSSFSDQNLKDIL